MTPAPGPGQLETPHLQLLVRTLLLLQQSLGSPGARFPLTSLPCAQVSLNKVGEYWWSAILEGEEHIDIEKINKERSMATVDDEEHAVLDRLTFDYHQKLQGKPQSHELVRGRAGRGAGCLVAVGGGGAAGGSGRGERVLVVRTGHLGAPLAGTPVPYLTKGPGAAASPPCGLCPSRPPCPSQGLSGLQSPLAE